MSKSTEDELNDVFQRPENMELMVQGQLEYRKRERRRRYKALCPWHWLMDPYPTERIYYARNRPTLREARYYWFRVHTGWTFLAKLRNGSGVKFAAAAGLASAVFQASPDLQKLTSFPVPPFLCLSLSGVLYLCAAVWLGLCCPQLLKYSIYSASEKQGKPGRMWLLSLVHKELLWWWQARPWSPAAFHKTEKDELARHLAAYGPTGFCGFNAYAQAHIEEALHEFSQATGVDLWREGEGRSGHVHFLPRHGYEGNRPLMDSLAIRRASEFDRSTEGLVKQGDLIVDWRPAHVTLLDSSTNKKIRDVSQDAEGLQHLFETDENAFSLAEIIGRWQDSRRPVARIVLILLYSASAFFFAMFVWLHTVSVIQALVDGWRI